MEAFGDSIVGKYCTVAKHIDRIPWEQRLEIIIHKEQGQWFFKFNDRKYVPATQVATFEPFEEDGQVKFVIEAFPHWIARENVAIEGCFVQEVQSVRLRLKQKGQGMTGLETWVSELEKNLNDSGDGSDTKQKKGTNPAYDNLMGRIAEEYSAPNSLPLKRRIDALMISKKGETILEEYFGGMTPATPHLTSSCTKTVTSLLAGIAMDQELFNLDDAVASYFPEVDSTWGDEPPVRIRHVLSMTAGTEHTLEKAQDVLESSDIEQLVLGWERAAEPGSRYNYDNGLPSLVGRVIERRSGLSLKEFAKLYLFDPLEITGQIWTEMPKQKRSPTLGSSILASGGLFLSLTEWAKIGQMLLENYPYGFCFHLNELGHVGKGPDKGRHLDGMAGYFDIGQGEQILFVALDDDLVVAAFGSTWLKDPEDPTTGLAVLRCINEVIVKS